MPPDDDTLEEQTRAFRPGEGAGTDAVAEEPVHLLLLLDDNAPPKRFPLHSLPAVIGRTSTRPPLGPLPARPATWASS